MNRSTPGLPVHHHLPEFTQSVILSSHLILGRPLLLLPPIPPSIRVFSNELSQETLKVLTTRGKIVFLFLFFWYLCEMTNVNQWW